MKGRQRGESGDAGQDTIVNADGSGEICPAVNHPVADGDERAAHCR